MIPVIKTEHLSCKMGQNYLLRDITWEVNPGEHWVVYGLNGSGKTTLLSIIAGYKNHSEGTLEVFGQPFSQQNVFTLRKRIGWVSGSFYDKHYTKESVLDIILSGKFGTLSLNYDISLADVHLAKKLATELGIGDKINHAFDMLSKGQRQNVMIARALFSNPELLVLDEPCSGLDVYNRAYLFSAIQKLAERNITVIYVTHYTEEILDIFEHSLLLSKGHIFAKGKTSELFTSAMLEKFLGYPVEIVQQTDGFQKLQVQATAQITELLKEVAKC